MRRPRRGAGPRWPPARPASRPPPPRPRRPIPGSSPSTPSRTPRPPPSPPCRPGGGRSRTRTAPTAPAAAAEGTASPPRTRRWPVRTRRPTRGTVPRGVPTRCGGGGRSVSPPRSSGRGCRSASGRLRRRPRSRRCPSRRSSRDCTRRPRRPPPHPLPTPAPRGPPSRASGPPACSRRWPPWPSRPGTRRPAATGRCGRGGWWSRTRPRPGRA